MNACCRGCRRSPSAGPSMVVGASPSHHRQRQAGVDPATVAQHRCKRRIGRGRSPSCCPPGRAARAAGRAASATGYSQLSALAIDQQADRQVRRLRIGHGTSLMVGASARRMPLFRSDRTARRYVQSKWRPWPCHKGGRMLDACATIGRRSPAPRSPNRLDTTRHVLGALADLLHDAGHGGDLVCCSPGRWTRWSACCG